jgi:hypothetical protein
MRVTPRLGGKKDSSKIRRLVEKRGIASEPSARYAAHDAGIAAIASLSGPFSSS